MVDVYCHSLGQAFERVATLHAARVALKLADGQAVTYATLLRRAQRIASALQAMGLGRGDLVALQNGKSVDGYAAMLACLRLGIAYVNLDPANPTERLRRVCEVCLPKAILHDADFAPSVGEVARTLGVSLVPIATLDAEFTNAPAEQPLGTDIAYVMFTSGSTGMPKGVAISHASVLNFIAWGRTTFDVTEADVLAAVNPVYFDNSVFDFYVALFNGAALAPIPPSAMAEPRSIVALVEQAECSIWFSVPSLLIYLMTMRVLDGSRFGTIRTMVFGGEGYPAPELSKLHRLYGGRIALVNVYGPTEGTCICSAYRVSEADLAAGGLPPLGRIAPNFGYLLLDGDVPVCEGEAGELCLTGPQLALGYYNEPALTAAAFVQNPLDRRLPQRIYRTGDLVMKREGLLHFVGRKDNQIKHMGYRIEIEEIELAIGAIDGVSQAAVVYNRVRDGFGHIVAHVATGGSGLLDADIRRALSAVLPAYMLPNRIVLVETLPKNANGKVDRTSLKTA